MNFSDPNFLTKLSSFIQVAAITLVFLGGVFQASKYFLDSRINKIKNEIAKEERLRAEESVSELQSTISQQIQEMGKQSEKIESQQKEILGLESKTSPRRIPENKFSGLQNDLSKYKDEKIEITSVSGDQEAFGFASQLKTLFQLSGWHVDGVNQSVFTKPINGSIIVMKDEGAKAKGYCLFHVFNSLGFYSTATIHPKTKYNVGIVVGAKNLEKEDRSEDQDYGYFRIVKVETVTLKPKDGGFIAELHLVFKNLGPAPIFGLDIDIFEVSYIYNGAQITFDLLDKSSSTKKLTVNTDEDGSAIIPWIKKSTSQEEFKEILRNTNTSFRFKASYLTFDDKKWGYEIVFNFQGDFSKEKGHSDRWQLNVLSENLFEL